MPERHEMRRWQPWWTACGSFRMWLFGWLDSGPWTFPRPPKTERCIMGYPVTDSVCCKRRTVSQIPGEPGYLWCKRHNPDSPAAQFRQLARLMPHRGNHA